MKSLKQSITRKIFRVLYLGRRQFSISEISKRTKISWNTVAKYIEHFVYKKYVLKEEYGIYPRYRFNFELHNKKKEEVLKMNGYERILKLMKNSGVLYANDKISTPFIGTCYQKISEICIKEKQDDSNEI